MARLFFVTHCPILIVKSTTRQQRYRLHFPLSLTTSLLTQPGPTSADHQRLSFHKAHQLSEGDAATDIGIIHHLHTVFLRDMRVLAESLLALVIKTRHSKPRPKAFSSSGSYISKQPSWPIRL